MAQVAPALAVCRGLAISGTSLLPHSASSLARVALGLLGPCSTQLRRYATPHAETTVYSADNIPIHTGRPRLVVLGTGWAAARLLRDINPKLYDLTVISKRNHMVFTPLLSSATVGTIESRDVAVHITDIQKALFQPQNNLYIAQATAVHPDRKVVECKSEDGVRFYVNYDKLAICTGSQGSTFGIPGVKEYCHFLRRIEHADAIRKKLMDNIAKAGIPGRPMKEWQRLLHIVIVGGGPTGVEVAGELTDFIAQDLTRLYPDRARAMKVTLVEAKELLGTFDSSLREYAARKLIRRGVVLRKGVVKEVTPNTVVLQDGNVLEYGLCIWSTGVGPTPFINSLPFAKTSLGRIAVDPFMRVLAAPRPQGAKEGEHPHHGPPEVSKAKVSILADESAPLAWDLPFVPDVYALGDCCATPDKPLPALAQVAEQQGRYLAKYLNALAEAPSNTPQADSRLDPAEPFQYRHLGAMATVGGASAVLELDRANNKQVSLAGFTSWVMWRSAYLTRLGSIPKRMAVAFDWTVTLLFGRDMSRW